MPNTPVKAPGGFAPAFALGQTDNDGNLTLVDSANPLPVRLSEAQGSAPAALAGSASAATIAGPFTPTPGRPIYVKLSGAWEGTVTVQRSVDGGVSRDPLTIAGSPWGVFNGNACEAVWEENEAGAEFYLDVRPAMGNIDYRVSQ